MIASIDIASIVAQVVSSSVIIEAVGIALLFVVIAISVFGILRSFLFTQIDNSLKNHEDRLRIKYKKDGYFGYDHPDHFGYQRKIFGFTYRPNDKKAREYYKKKARQNAYKHYERHYTKQYAPKTPKRGTRYYRRSKRYKRF